MIRSNYVAVDTYMEAKLRVVKIKEPTSQEQPWYAAEDCAISKLESAAKTERQKKQHNQGLFQRLSKSALFSKKH